MILFSASLLLECKNSRLAPTRHIPNMATAESAASKQQNHFSRRILQTFLFSVQKNQFVIKNDQNAKS